MSEDSDRQSYEEKPRDRGFYVVCTEGNERYLVDTYSAATAAFIVESQFGEVVDSVHTTQFKKILLMGAANDSTESHLIEATDDHQEGPGDEPTTQDDRDEA